MKNFIVVTLETHDYHYMQVDKGEQSILSAASQRPDTILLDLGLPDMDGVDMILKIHSWIDTPIIVISVRSEDSDKIAALDVGASDYSTKSLSVNELLARLRSTQRQLSHIQSLEEVWTSLLVNSGLTIDYVAGRACLDGEELYLIPYECRFPYLPTHNVGRTLTHSYMTQEMWGATWEGDVALLCVLMASLWKKIEKNPSQP